mgnify:FL=1
MSAEEQKRAELKLKYENWIKKNKTRLFAFSIIYLIILLLNFIIFKNNKITILSSLLFFTYTIYTYTLIWFINNKLMTEVDSIDFKN